MNHEKIFGMIGMFAFRLSSALLGAMVALDMCLGWYVFVYQNVPVRIEFALIWGTASAVAGILAFLRVSKSCMTAKEAVVCMDNALAETLFTVFMLAATLGALFFFSSVQRHNGMLFGSAAYACLVAGTYRTVRRLAESFSEFAWAILLNAQSRRRPEKTLILMP